MAYGREPWVFHDWPAIWVNRSLVELEHFEPPPDFGELAKQGGMEEGDETAP